MTIYNFDDGQLDFDFDSTEPPVFRIVVRPRQGHSGAFAEALFRGGHDEHLWSVAAWGQTEEEALEVLLDELRQRYATSPNRVVVEIEDSVAKMIRAERPDDLLVLVYDRDLGNYYNRQHTVQKLTVLDGYILKDLEDGWGPGEDFSLEEL